MNMKHKFLPQFIRHLIQATAFLLFPALFISAFAAVRDIVTAAATGSFSLTQLAPQIVLTSALFVTTAFLGRFFCGYLCAFGTFQEVLHFFSKQWKIPRPKLSARTEHILKSLKYAILAATAVFIWILQVPVDSSSWSPWGVFGVLVSGNYQAIPALLLTPGFLLFVGIMAGALFIPRFFCRYLCPLGAMLALTSRFRPYRIRRQPETCTHCGICVRTCSMGISIPAKNSVKSGECIQCMECLPVCPPASLSIEPSGTAVGMAAVAVIGGSIVLGDSVSLPRTDIFSAEKTTLTERDAAGKYQDGIYTGTGKGFRGTVEAEVTVEDGSISDITILSYGDDRQFFQMAQSEVISQILRTQNTDVKAVSGATYSSYGIMDAVADALGADGIISDTPAVTSDYTPQMPEEEERPSGAEITVDEPQTAAASGIQFLEDGIYEGQGSGFRGTTEVAVTVEDGKITDITILSFNDDTPYFTRARNAVISSIISSQSLDVSTVSGATYSSNGILEAVSDALGLEYAGANQSRSAAATDGAGRRGSKGHRQSAA